MKMFSAAAWTLVGLERLWQDIRYGARMLAASPAFTIVAVLSLAMGIGANSAIFSFADALLLRPLPVPRPAGVMTVGSAASLESLSATSLIASYPEYVDIRERTRSFESLTAFRYVTGRKDWSGSGLVRTASTISCSRGRPECRRVPCFRGRL